MAPPQVFQLRPNLRRVPKPYLSNLLSFSSTSDSQNTNTPSSESREEPSRTFHNPPNPPSGVSDILKNISLTRNRNASSPGPPSGAERSFHPSLEELFKRNEMSMSKGDGRNSETTQSGSAKLNFDAIREKLRNQNQNQNMNRTVPRSRFSDILKMRPNNDSNARESPLVIGGSDHLPASIFGREMRDKRDRNSSVESSTSMKFVKTYEFKELGEKLTKLRPEKKLEKNWFSIGELNDRLMKVWEKEKELWETEKANNPASGNMFKELRGALVQLQISNDDKSKKTMIQRLDVLGSLGGTPKFMLHPPKAHLLEKYLHPDNLSAEEKMKLELQKVRDEFKMSESDCGSSRVQVAQLTTKIKYLSGVLHKKDKHSRKGLQAMVQKRKKLLKYLRRTDWDSYSLVLSKLGLRDNPDYKF